MCGFYFSTKNFFTASRHSKMLLRGPDSIRDMTINGCRFVHAHLSIFSPIHEQPFISEHEEVVLLFNGEIYNTPGTKSECEFIVEQYRIFGAECFKHLDGEFAILLADFYRQEIIIGTDPFGTKPCFFSTADGLFVSSYPSSIFNEGVDLSSIMEAAPNTAYRFCLKRKSLIDSRHIISWNLEQFDDSFDKWSASFDSAIAKRTRNMIENHIPFVGISSGYDSGAIHASLLKIRRQFLGISVSGVENTALLFERQALSSQAGQTHLVLDDRYLKSSIRQIENFIHMSVEDLPYKIRSDARTVQGEPMSVLSDKASIALAVIASIARRAGSIINISGSGADETISDYGYNGIPIFQHSNFGGLWPKNLQDIFPWASFNYSTQQAYLWKEEAVGGAFSIENRYPFLDKGVVQAYLNLTPDLKNMRYKAPISFYLESCNYPYRQEKLGFSPFKKGGNHAA